MRRQGVVVALSLILASAGEAAAQKTQFIDWTTLKNPVLSYPQWSVKDAALAFREGTFYVFFSAFYPDAGQVRCHVVEISTRDFKHYSKPILNFDGEEDGWLGMCSPDVQRLHGKYVMTFNTWGHKPDKPDQLFYMVSDDLVHWSQRKALALNLTHVGDQRVIDGALAEADGGYYLVYKEQTPGVPKRPRIAFAKNLDGPFAYVRDGLPALLMRNGKEDGLLHENYELISIDRHWYLLATDYHPQAPYLYRLDPASDWLRWIQGRTLEIPREKFNARKVADASALYDWRSYDGYYYLIYAGRTEDQSYAGRGWNQIGLARSKDLVHWSVPGSSRP